MSLVKKGSRVKIYYSCRLKDGRVYETNTGGAPLEFTVGKGKVIKGMENAVTGMRTGETKTVVIKPAEGYGPKDHALIWTVAAAELPAGTPLEVSAEVAFTSADGNAVEGRIVKIEGDRITIDGNHPLAGRNLTFEIRIVEAG